MCKSWRSVCSTNAVWRWRQEAFFGKVERYVQRVFQCCEFGFSRDMELQKRFGIPAKRAMVQLERATHTHSRGALRLFHASMYAEDCRAALMLAHVAYHIVRSVRCVRVSPTLSHGCVARRTPDRVCTACGESTLIGIAYGRPSTEMSCEYAGGKIELGGCVIMPGCAIAVCKCCGTEVASSCVVSS